MKPAFRKGRLKMRKLAVLLVAFFSLFVACFSACASSAATVAPSDVTIRVTGYLTQIDQDKSFPPERQAEIDAHALQFPDGSDPNYLQWSADLDKKYPVVYEKVSGLYFIGDITVTANGISTTTDVSGATPRDFVLQGASNHGISCTFHNTDFPDLSLPEYLQVDIIKDGKVVVTSNTTAIWHPITVAVP
jgi:hypothetical protein